MSREATRHYCCCCCSFNITANGIVCRCVTGQGVQSMNDILLDTAWETPCDGRSGLRLCHGSRLGQAPVSRESLQRRLGAAILATSPESAPCHHHLSLHASTYCDQTLSWCCVLLVAPSIIFIRLHNLQIGPVCILDYRCLAIKFGCLLDRVNQNWLLADSLVVDPIWATVVMPLVAVVSSAQ